MQQLVSIIVCTYNGAAFLEQQLDTLVQQTWKHLEIIICDDNSTDDTQRIIREFAAKDARISYHFNTSNIGVNRNFEKGCKHAKGDLIAMCDQDDIWLDNKIEKLVDLMQDDKIMLAHSQSVRFKDEVPYHIKFNKKRHPMTGNDSRRLFYFNTIAGHNIMFRKELLQHAIPFPEGVFYDWWLCMAATCYGHINATTEVLSYHREHANNVTLGKKDEKKQTKGKAAERTLSAAEFLKIEGMENAHRSFGKRLLENLHDLSGKTFSFRLFMFLLANAGTIFFFKRSAFPFFSYVKISYRLSWAV